VTDGIIPSSLSAAVLQESTSPSQMERILQAASPAQQ
jgi:hypothetical protein